MINADAIRTEGTWQLALHMKLTNGGVHFQYRSFEHRRLLCTKSRANRTARMQWCFFLTGDDRKFETLEDAVAALNQEAEDRAWEAADPARVAPQACEQ